MAVPTVMADLSTTAASNSPAGSESPISTDDFHRAIQSILRHTNAKGADIASATTTDIGAATGEFVDVTGTTTITGLGTIAAGIVRTVRFTGALTLTHNGTSLILPGAANITTAANDTAVFRSLGSGNWLCIAYKKASGDSITSYLSLAGGTMTGDITMSGAMDKWAKGADVASATALPLITDGNYFDVTGTTTITSFDSVGVGAWITLQFDGALTLTHSATDLILPGGANILTAAGDTAVFVEYASGDWVCLNYQRGGGIGVNVREVSAVSLSGTTVNISTTIPSWAKKITGMVIGASTNGTDGLTVQLGDSVGFETTGYVGAVQSSGTAVQYGNAFDITGAIVAAGNYSGLFQLSKVPGTNTWASSSNIGRGDVAVAYYGAGYKTLSDPLTQLRMLTRSGSDSYDGGTCSLLIEG